MKNVNPEEFSSESRNSGIELIGKIPWGTHLCQFYQSRDDLIEILVPYFKTGLNNNEFCMWITAEPLGKSDAKAALKKVVKTIDRYLKSGQLEILDYSEWYTKSGKFDAESVLKGWVDKEKAAINKGYDGLRLTGNTFWLEKEDWKKFKDYEETVNKVIGQHKMLAICSYSLDRCDASEIIDVVANHQFALIHRKSNWEIIESSERKHTEEQALLANERLHHLLSSSSAVIYTAKTAGDYDATFISDNVLEMIGYKPEDFLKKPSFWLNHVHPDDRLRISSEVGRLHKTGFHTYEYRFKCKDGKYVWVNDEMKLVKDKNGKPIEIIGFWSDITDRRCMEENLRESEEKFRTISEQNNMGICILQDNVIKYINQAMVDIYGYTINEVLNWKPFEFLKIFAPDTLETAKEQAKKKQAGVSEQLVHYTVHGIKKNGDDIWVDNYSKTIFYEGHPADLITQVNITDGKRTELALKESEERFRSMAEYAPNFITLINQEHKITYINHPVPGLTKDDVIGKKVYNFILPDYHKLARKKIDAVFKTGKDQSYISKAAGPDGSAAWYDNRLGPIIIDGKVVGVTFIATDITEQKLTEESLRASEKRFRDLAESLPEVVFETDLNLTLIYANKRAFDLFGYSSKDFTRGLNGFDMLAIEERERARNNIAKRLKGKNIGSTEYQALKKDGTTFPIFLHMNTIEKEGKVTGFRGIIVDITHLKAAEERIAELAKFPEQNPNPVLRITKDGEIFYQNDASKFLLKFWKYKPGGKLSKKWLKHVEVALNENIIKNIEVESKNKIVSLVFTPIIGLGFVNVYGLDITERKSVERALIESEKKYRYLIDNLSDTVIELDSDGNFTYISPQVNEIFEFKPEELVGRNCLEFVHPDDLEGIIDKMTEAMKKNQILTYEYRALHKKGHYINVMASGRFLRTGSVMKYIGVVYDITDRIRKDKALKESEEKLRSIFESSPDAITITDLDGMVIDCNQAALKLQRFSSREELIGKKAFDYITPDSLETALKDFNDIVDKGIKNNVIYKIKDKSGRELPVETSASIIQDITEKPVAIMAITKDITERKNSEEMINRSLHEKEVLLKEIHHRVKNNMQIISSLLRLQSRTITDEFISTIFKESENRIRSMALIHEKLYRSKDLANINFHDYVQTLTKDLFRSYKIDPGKIKIKLDIKDVEFKTEQAIPCGLILNELVSNSLKYAFPENRKGEIKISLTKEYKNGYRLNISDTGIGIPKNIDIKKTASLGLHLVQMLVEDQLQGTVELNRTIGSEFEIIFNGSGGA